MSNTVFQKQTIKVRVKDNDSLQSSTPVTLKNSVGQKRSLTELFDVTITNPANSNILVYQSNTSNWINRTATTISGNSGQIIVANTNAFDFNLSFPNTVIINQTLSVSNGFSTNSSVTTIANGSFGTINVSSAYIANGIIVGGSAALRNIIPDANNAYTIGNSSFRYATLWLSGNTLYMGNVVFTDTATSLGLTTSNGSPISVNMGNTIVNGSLSVASSFQADSLAANTLTINRTSNLVGNVAIGGILRVANNAEIVGNLQIDGTINRNPNINIILTGDVTGTANATMADLTSVTISINTTSQGNSVQLGVDTFGSYVANIANGTGVFISNTSGGETEVPVIAIGQDVRTNSTVTFATANITGNLTVNGAFTVANTTITGFANISSTANIGGVLTARSDVIVNGALTVANTAALGNTTITGFANVAGNLQVTDTIAGNNMTLSGNLTVSGTTTYINTTALNVGDNIITLNADVLPATSPTENAGIEVNRGSSANVSFLWNEAGDYWDIGNTNVTGYVNASSVNVTGAATVNGAFVVNNTASLGNTTITGFANVVGNVNVTSLLTSANLFANVVSTNNFTTNLISVTTPAATANIAPTTAIAGWNYSGKFRSVAAEESAPTGLFLSPDGLNLYVNGTTGDDVNQYTLSSAWDVSTATFVRLFLTSAQDSNPNDIFFKPDGLSMFILGLSNDTVFQYTLSSAWDISTASYASKSFSVTSQEITPTGLWFKPDGTVMYVIGQANDTVYQYNLGTAWDVSTASYASISFNVTSQEANPTQVNLSADGKRMWVVGQTGDDINEYSLGTDWNVSTATFVNNFYVGFQDSAPSGLFIDSTAANRVYVVGPTNDAIYQYNTETNSISAVTDVFNTTSNARVQGNLAVQNNTYVDGTFVVQGAATLGTTTVGGTFTTTSTSSLAFTTGTITATFGSGATLSGATKTLTIGAAGVSGSITNLTIGSAVSGATTNTLLYSNTFTVTGGNTHIGGLIGGESFRVIPTVNSNNYLQVAGAVTGAGPTLSAQGLDASVDLNVTAKGTANVNIGTTNGVGLRIQDRASATRPIVIRPGATGVSAPIITVESDLASQGIDFTAKNAGTNRFIAAGQVQFQVSSTTSAVNYLDATGAATGSGPTLSVQGSDTNINFNIAAKGTGVVNISPALNVPGNATVNGAFVVNNTASIGNTTVTGFVNATASVNSAVLSVGTNFIANSIGITTTGFANIATTVSVGANVIANGINANTLTANIATFNTSANVGANVQLTTSQLLIGNATVNTVITSSAITGNPTVAAGNTTVTGFVNATSSVNSAILSVGTAVIANSTGITTTGFVNAAGAVNAASHTVGTSFIANSTGITTTGFANVGTRIIGNLGGADSNTFAGVGLDINSSVMRIGDGQTNLAMSNGTGIKIHDSGNSHKSIGQIGNTLYISDTSTDGNSLFPATRTDLIVANTSAINLNTNTSITGFINVSSTANIGGAITARSTVTVNGALTVANTAALGNTTINGFANVTGNLQVSSVFATGSVQIDGDLIVNGNTVSINVTDLKLTDNLIFLNEPEVDTITSASSNGTAFIYVSNNGLTVGMNVTVTGINPSGYNVTANTITFANATHFAVANTTSPGAYVSGGLSEGRSGVNPDLGFTGEYNDGTVRHAGFFRDATDGVFKVFDQYQPEPNGAFIDTSNNTFRIAAFQANATTLGTLTTGNTTISGFANITSTANIGGILSARSDVAVNGALTVANTAALGNTTVTGFANVSTSVNSALLTVGTSFIANTTGAYHTGTVNAASFTTTGVTANITGVYVGANVSVTSSGWSIGNTTANTTANSLMLVFGSNSSQGIGFYSAGNTYSIMMKPQNDAAAGRLDSVSDFNMYFNMNAGTNRGFVFRAGNTTSIPVAQIDGLGALYTLGSYFIGNSTVNATITATTLSINTVSVNVGNFAVSANVGSNVNISTSQISVGNTTVNTVITSSSLATGNTSVTGFINVSSTANIGGVITARSNVTVNGALTVANTAALGNTTITGFANVTGNGSFGTGLANFVQLAGGTSGSSALISAQGSDSNVALNIAAKASANINLNSNTNFAANTLTFTGSAGSNTNIALRVLSDGVLSFEGGVGQLFSISNSMSGQIFAVNDISGIPSLEVYSNGQVNIARFGGNVSIGTSTSTITVNGSVTFGNTLTLANNLSVTGFVNATASVNSAVLSVGTSFIANTTGAYHTGTINAASHTVGTAFIANSTGVTTTGFANVATTISVGANVIANTTALFVGNSTVNTVITQNTLQVANATGTSLFVAANGNVGVGNSTPGSKLVVQGSARLESAVSVGGSGRVEVDAPNFGGGRLTITADPTGNGTNFSPNANVGIGNSAPAHKLRVEGNASISSSLNVATTFASGNATITGFANVVGNLQVTDTITGNNLTLSGNLTVSGTTTYINTTTLNIGDNIITLNADVTGATAPTENAGIEVNRGSSANVSFVWNETSDFWALGNTTVTGYVNATASVNSAVLSVGTAVIANSTGITTTGFANVGTTVSVGANVIANTTALFVGNSTVNTVITQTTAAFNANSTTTALFVAANGNIGIGYTTPGHKLRVAGTIIGDANDNFFGNFSTGDYVDIGNLGATGSVYFDARGASSNISVNYRAKGAAGHFWTNQGGSTEVMRIAANNNVGIGNNTPAHLLRVEANTSINGTVFATVFDIGSNMFLGNSSGNLALNFDSNDYLTYNKTNNQLTFFIGGNAVLLSNTTNLQVNSAANVTGTLTHGGLVPSAGIGIDQIFTATPSLTLNTNWQSTGVTSTNLANGTYVVQLLANDVAAGGTANNEYYSGMMSWYSADTNSTILDEIPLHRAGVNGSNNAIFLATQRTATANTSDLILMISSAANNSSSSTYTLRFRRMI